MYFNLKIKRNLLNTSSFCVTMVLLHNVYTQEIVSTLPQISDTLDSIPNTEKSEEEVIVVGYGTQKRGDITGSVAVVKGDVIKEYPVVSVDQALQARAPGVQVSQASAAPGGGASVRIRGSNSLTSGSEPLYVIDGFPLYPDNTAYGVGGNRQPTNMLSSINPNDIASIDILKDASATSIYGSRGANGVILITTKRGNSQGVSKFTFSGSSSMQKIGHTPQVLNGADYARYMNIIDRKITYTDAQIEAIGTGTNWLNEITRVGMFHNYQVGFYGGNKSTKYALSGNYNGNDGIVTNTNFTRYGLRLNLDNDLFSGRIKISSSWTYSRTVSNNAPTDRGGPGGIIITALGLDPIVPVMDPVTGKYSQVSYDGRFFINPVEELKYVVDRDLGNRILGNTIMTIEIVKGLSFKTSIGADLYNANRTTFYPDKTTLIGRDQKGELTLANRSIINILNENLLHYNIQISNAHKIDFVGGYTYQEETNNIFVSTVRFIPTVNVSEAKLQDGAIIASPSSNRASWNLMSFLTRINYSFKDKYLLTLTVRRDGSSRFGDANKWANFPSAALGWKISEEDFFTNSAIKTIINNLKFRASWGVTGNSNIPVYNSLANLSQYSYIFNNVYNVGFGVARIANPNLKWERTQMYNVGLDISLLNNRFNINTDLFYNRTTDLLLNVAVPGSLGFSSVLKNTGSLENKGFELGIDAVIISSKTGFEWTIGGNISVLRNTILDLGESAPFFSDGGTHLGVEGSWVETGNPIGVWKGFKYLGLFQSQDQIDKTAHRANDKPGYPIYQDINKDGKIDDDDRVIIGDPNPDFTYGLNTKFSYKGFDIAIFFVGVQGNDVRNLQQSEMGDGVQKINQLSNILKDSWTPNNPNATRPVVDPDRDFANSYRKSDFFIEDGSFLRLQNISFGYNFSIKKLIQNARVYISGQNLVVFTKYSGFDPEVNMSGQSNLNKGVDYDAYPRSRTFTIGINFDLF